MTLELGLQLAQAHSVTRWQLENALQAQLIYRGPLLVNLIRLGYLPEDEAIRFCSRLRGIPVVRESVLRQIPERTLRMIPKDLVFQWRVLPAGVRDGVLVLASHLPLSPETLEESAFLVGMRTRLVLCAERLLIQAIRYYYGISLPSWITDERLAGQFEEPEPLDAGDATTPPTLVPPLTETVVPVEPRARSLRDTEIPVDDEPVAPVETHARSLHDTQIPLDDAPFTPKLVESGDPNDPLRDHVAAAIDLVRHVAEDADGGALSQTRPEVSVRDDDAAETLSLTEASVPLSALPAASDCDLDAFEDLMALAEDRDGIIRAACAWLGRQVLPVVFLNLKQDVLSGFHLENLRRESDIRALSLPSDSPRAFSQVTETGECVTADLTEDEGLSALAEFLGAEDARRGLLLPVHLRGRVVGVLVVLDTETEALPSENPEVLRRIRRVVSDSFETLILSKKIGV